jgi:SAM-dependent methyltransferase
MTHTLLPADFDMLQPMTPYLADRIHGYGLRHAEIGQDERDCVLRDCIKAVHEQDLPTAGVHRKSAWEAGWFSNLKQFDPAKAGRELARPGYYNKYPYVRWKGHFYKAFSPDYEQNMLAVIQDYVFDKYFRHQYCVYEFGCGTGHNLFRVRDVNPHTELVGLDWAESAVEFINLQAQAGAYGWHQTNPEEEPQEPLAKGVTFDFFKPDWNFRLYDLCGVYTVAALEQLGPRFHAWLHYILTQGPRYVAHIEPIAEVLDPNNLLDYLSIEYFKKRGYLSGYLDYLRLLEQVNKVKIHEVTRTTVGSMFIEGYTILVWSPI